MLTTDASRQQVWSEKLFRSQKRASFFLPRFEGGEEAIVNSRTELKAKGALAGVRNGDKITFTLVPRIDVKEHPGVISGQTAKGNEVTPLKYSFSIELERYRLPVYIGEPMDWQRASYDIPTSSKAILKQWGVDKLDQNHFDAIFNFDSTTKIFYVASGSVDPVSTTTFATAKNALSATDSRFTPAFLSFIATNARTGGNRSYEALREVSVDGRKYLVALVHSDALHDWKNNSVVQQASREAMERGKDNPLFRGADYVWDNVVIYGHQDVPVASNGGSGSNVNFGYGVLMGAQALCTAWGESPDLVEDDEDYKEKFFACWRVTMKVGVPQFNSKRYGSIGFLVAQTNVSGA